MGVESPSRSNSWNQLAAGLGRRLRAEQGRGHEGRGPDANKKQDVRDTENEFGAGQHNADDTGKENEGPNHGRLPVECEHKDMDAEEKDKENTEPNRAAPPAEVEAEAKKQRALRANATL